VVPEVISPVPIRPGTASSGTHSMRPDSATRMFRERLASVICGGARQVVVDLARVTFMASAGVAVLMGMHRVLAGQSGSLVVAAPSPAVGRVLSLVGLDQVIPVTGSVADAAARWAAERIELPGVPGCPGVTVRSRTKHPVPRPCRGQERGDSPLRVEAHGPDLQPGGHGRVLSDRPQAASRRGLRSHPSSSGSAAQPHRDLEPVWELLAVAGPAARPGSA
jgi:anti-anti-sigma factor